MLQSYRLSLDLRLTLPSIIHVVFHLDPRHDAQGKSMAPPALASTLVLALGRSVWGRLKLENVASPG